MSTPLPLPPGARLVHVGPHKTGTTALQSALHQARDDMAAQGVRYASRTRHDRRAAEWIVRRLIAGADPGRAERAWDGLAERLTADTSDRRIFSSEFLSDASDDRIEEILARLSTDNLWIAVTLRPLARILPSQYQQGIQRGGVRAYDEWLHSVLDVDPARPAPPQFWVRHRHDELVRRWSARLGPDHVVVVVIDPADHSFLPHTFEDLLGLRRNTLSDKKVRENRSLTAVEVELLRRFNRHFLELGLGSAHYARLVDQFKRHVKRRQPPPDEPRLLTPDWAIDRANEIGREMADDIRASGAPVIGDLDSLGTEPSRGVSATPEPPTTIDVDVAAWFATGLALAATRTQPASTEARQAEPPPRSIARRVRARRRR